MATADEYGMTCAHIAAVKGSVQVINELMRFDHTAVTRSRNKRNLSTPLHLAAAGGHQRIVQVLLEAGASSLDENGDGWNVVHLAAQHGHLKVIECLPNLRQVLRQASSKSGLTALHIASYHGQMELVRELLGRIPAAVRSEPPMADGGLPGVFCESGLTALHLAAHSGQEAIVRLLLNYSGVQVDAATMVNGSTPLHLAAQHGHSNVVSLLLSKSTIQLHSKDKRGRTPLHLAAANGHYNMVGLLLGQGAEIDASDKNGWTPLHFACKAGYLDVIRFLVEGGASTTTESKDGKVALSLAAHMQHTAVISYLLGKDHDTEHLLNERTFVFDLMLCAKLNQNRAIDEFVLSSNAPPETAARLSSVFLALSEREKERAKDLLAAAEYAEQIGTELIAIASSICGAKEFLRSVDARGTPFLDVLIETEQKEAVSHPAVQKHLSDVWSGSLANWSTFKLGVLFFGLLISPIVWVALSMPCGTRLNNVPLVKFMSYLVSHLYFIVLLSITVISPFESISQKGSLMPAWHEWLLLAWISGLLVSELTNPSDKASLGGVRVIIIAVCALAVNIQGVPNGINRRLEIIYIRNQLLALSLLLCCVLNLEFFLFHHLFGPWAIIIRDLMKDLLRFIVILSIFVVGFTVQMTAAYQPVYEVTGSLNGTVGDGRGGANTPSVSVYTMFEMLFFALFGLVEPERLPNIAHTPAWSIVLAKSIFGLYMIVSIIVLINLLIAMMSDTYQRIQAQSDIEWKFGRAKLIRNMNKTSATPSPLNMFTKLYTYILVIFKYGRKVCSPDAQDLIDFEEGFDTDSLLSAEPSYHLFGANLRRSSVAAAVAMSNIGTGGLGGRGGRGPGSGDPHAKRIEDVVDWHLVIARFKAMRGDSVADPPFATNGLDGNESD